MKHFILMLFTLIFGVNGAAFAQDGTTTSSDYSCTYPTGASRKVAADTWNIAFLKTTDNEPTDKQEKAALAYFRLAYPNAQVIGPTDFTSQNLADKFIKTIWIHVDRQGINKSGTNPNPDNVVRCFVGDNASADEIAAFKATLKAFSKGGGNLYLSGHATLLVKAIDRQATNYDVNVFDDGEAKSLMETWSICGKVQDSNHEDNSGHAIYGAPFDDFQGYFDPVKTGSETVFNMLGPGNLSIFDHNCMWNYVNDDFRRANNAQVIGTWGQETGGNTYAGIVEFLPDGKGTIEGAASFDGWKGNIIANGIAACQWTPQSGVNQYQYNLERLTFNTLNYLTQEYNRLFIVGTGVKSGNVGVNQTTTTCESWAKESALPLTESADGYFYGKFIMKNLGHFRFLINKNWARSFKEDSYVPATTADKDNMAPTTTTGDVPFFNHFATANATEPVQDGSEDFVFVLPERMGYTTAGAEKEVEIRVYLTDQGGYYTYEREVKGFQDCGYNTTFACNVAMEVVDGGTKAYYATHASGSNDVVMHEIANIPAQTGVLLKNDNDSDIVVRPLVGSQQTAAETSNNCLQGVYLKDNTHQQVWFAEPQSGTKEEKNWVTGDPVAYRSYLLDAVKDNGAYSLVFKRSHDGKSFTERAYLRLTGEEIVAAQFNPTDNDAMQRTATVGTATDQSNGAKGMLRVVFETMDGTSTTQIGGVAVSERNTGNAWYTLQGIRLGKPTQSGIYVHNGRKVVIK